MKRTELKKEYREALASNYKLRCAIGLEVGVHQYTLQRQATNNSPKLTTKHFLAAFRKHGSIDKSVDLIEQVVITMPHEVTA